MKTVASLFFPLLSSFACGLAWASPAAPAAVTSQAGPTDSPRPIASAVAPGQLIYQRACMSCHQADGKGQPGLFPPLRDTDWIKERDPARLIRIVLHGMVGPLSVNGVPFRSSAPFMPGHAASLTDEEIATVLTWIRKEMAGSPIPVTAAGVSTIRQSESTRTALWTEAQLLALPLSPPTTP